MLNSIHISIASCFKKLSRSFLILLFVFLTGGFVQAKPLADSKTEMASLPAPPIAYFTTDRVSGCSDFVANFPVTITDESVGATSWRYRIYREGTPPTLIYNVTTPLIAPAPLTYTFTNNTSFPIEYTIELLVRNAASEESTYSKVITVYPSINAQFSQTLVGDICANPREVRFTNQSSSNTNDNYFWKFGDGENYVSTTPNEVFTHNFENLTNSPVTYDVSLIAQSTLFGCRDTATSQVTVTSYLLPQFNVSHTAGCAPLDVTVTNKSLGDVLSYSWTITEPYAVPPVGANTNSFTRTLQNPGNTPANYTITLTVTNSDGCTKPLSKVITVNPQVQVSFIPVNSVVCDSTEVTFTTTLTHTSLPNITYNWNFGDGGSSPLKSPAHLFRNTGNVLVNRNVTLTATSEYGCFGTFATTVGVHPYTKPEFTVSKAEICSGESITFTYQRMPSISNYQWNFTGYTDNVKPADSPVGTFVKTFVNQTGSPMSVNVELTVTNTFGCPKIFTVPITINPEVTADFGWTGDSPLGCNPLDVSFANTTIFTGPEAFNGSYYWDFGDAATSTEVSPEHTFNNDDPNGTETYSVTLTATSVHGCVDDETQSITVQPRLTAGFSIQQPDICVPVFVFTPSSPGATTYDWDFDGLIPPEALPNGNSFIRTINPTDADNLTTGVITLTVGNGTGCTDMAARDIEIHPFIVPIFSADETVGCSDLEVTFSNSSTGGALRYNWDFDDEQTYTTSSQSDILHNFVNRGPTDRPFQVSLTATNAIGCSETSDATITVHPKVEADFSFTYDSVCTPFRVEITNNSLNGTWFNWDFGQTGVWVADTITHKNNSVFRYTLENPELNSIGNYSIDVYAYTDHASGHRCESDTSFPIEVYPRIVANFVVDVDEGCNALDVQFTNSSTGLGSYRWDFDDGSFSDVESPPKTFAHANRESSETFTVSLTSTNRFGCKDIAEREITVYPLVEAAFALSDDDGCTPLTTYTNNSAVSPAYVYSWDFGDGQTSTLAQPDSITLVNNIALLALFEPVITLETSLNLVDYPEGCPETFSQQVTVYPHIFPDFTADFDGCHPLPVEFTNTTETIGGTNNATYLWSFGNGVTSNSTDFSQNYYNPSLTQDETFTVWLRGYSAYGCADSISHDVTVYPKPQSIMELVSDYFACSPYEFEIQNRSKGKIFDSTLEFFYDFGDGEDSTTFSGANMLHPYRNLTDLVEPYTISLYVESEDGCRDTSYQTIYVYPEVTAEFNFNPGDADCSPFVVTMENTSTNASFYHWSFGDDLGATSTLFEPTHRFVNNTMIDQIFDVSLIATSEYNCVDYDTLQLMVYSAPDARFTISPPLKVFPDADFAFLNQTFPSAEDWTYTWTFGDGYGSNEKDPAPHTYETWGPAEDNFQYLVTLTVENDNCPDHYADFLTLRPPVPFAQYEANEYESCSPLVVYFDNQSEHFYTNPDSTAFLWDFGDGTISNERDPIHTFQDSGFYNVSLTVYGDGGVSTFFWVFRVHENPIANFAVTPQVVILPNASVHIYNLSENASSYIWDLGDGTIANTKDVVHTYADVGEYGIHLTAYTDYGCVDTTSKFPAVWVKSAGIIRFPNAFSPSKLGPSGGYYDDVDYKNEVFHPIEVAVAEFKLLIFNRWGEQIFESNDVKIGWDGYYKGKLCSQDVYVYRAIGKYTNGTTFDVKGNVTLLR